MLPESEGGPHRGGVAPPREWSVLLAGLLSAAALVWAAFVSFGDAQLAGEVLLRRTARELGASVEESWRLLLLSGEFGDAVSGEPLQWTHFADLAETSAPREFYGAPAEPDNLFDILYDSALDLESQAKPAAQILDELLIALDREEASPRRPEARLHAIRLAVQLQRHLIALEQWRLSQTELQGHETRNGTSYRLLCTLAARQAFEPGRRQVVAEQLVQEWSGGKLALPGAWRPVANPRQDTSSKSERPAARIALEGAIAKMAAAGMLEEWQEMARERERTREVLRVVGSLPSIGEDAWNIATQSDLPVAARLIGEEVHAYYLDLESLIRVVQDGAQLPSGFTLDHRESRQSNATRLGNWKSLNGPGFGYELHHVDPSRLRRSEERRLLYLRLAFLALAICCMGATVMTLRAMRRERRLGEMKRDFIASVSHELRTPLSSILLMSENLVEGRLSGDSAKERYYGAIHREADRLRRLVDDVLDFARIERGEPTRLRTEEVEVRSFVATLGAELSERAIGAQRRIEFHAEELHGHALLDTDAVRRALWNLVDNAFKHGGGSARVTALHDGEGALCLHVADDGPGVPEAQRAQIFKPYARLNGSGAVGGTGLGLAIVAEIARAHGGSVAVRAGADGKGALFELRLAMQPEDGEALDMQEEQA